MDKAKEVKKDCDCVNKLFDHYNKEIPGGIEFINSSNFVNMKTGKSILRPPTLRFMRHKLNKEGKVLKQTCTNYITPNFCQFCGKEYR